MNILQNLQYIGDHNLSSPPLILSYQNSMLEGHEIEVCQLSGGPDFPVGGHDIKIGGFQVSLDILKIKVSNLNGFMISIYRERQALQC